MRSHQAEDVGRRLVVVEDSVDEDNRSVGTVVNPGQSTALDEPDFERMAESGKELSSPGPVSMTTRASGVGRRAPRPDTNRLTLAYFAGQRWSPTRSCQMAIAFRPCRTARSIRSRYGSQALAVGDRLGSSAVAARSGSVDTPSAVAGFASRSASSGTRSGVGAAWRRVGGHLLD